jgi:hypothetical protein
MGYYGNNSGGGYNNYETTNPFAAPTMSSALPTYAQYVPSSYSPYNNHGNTGGGYPHQQQHQQQHNNHQSPQSVVYVNNNDYWEDDYNNIKEDTHQDQHHQLVNYAATPSHHALPSPSWTYDDEENTDESSVDESKLKRITKTWCSKNSTPCILLGMAVAILFIIAYVYLVEAFVTRSRVARNATLTGVSLNKAYGDTYSGLRSVGKGSSNADVVGVETTVKNSYGSTTTAAAAAAAAQLLPDMEPRYYVLDQILRPLDVGEVPPPAAKSSSVPAEDGEEEDDNEEDEEGSSMVIPALVQAKHEPV